MAQHKNNTLPVALTSYTRYADLFLNYQSSLAKRCIHTSSSYNVI